MINAIVTLSLVSLIKVYQKFLSPFLGEICRFYPSCSDYACQCLKKFSAPRALFLISRRLLKCHPYCQGGLDPI